MIYITKIAVFRAKTSGKLPIFYVSAILLTVNPTIGRLYIHIQFAKSRFSHHKGMGLNLSPVFQGQAISTPDSRRDARKRNRSEVKVLNLCSFLKPNSSFIHINTLSLCTSRPQYRFMGVDLDVFLSGTLINRRFLSKFVN